MTRFAQHRCWLLLVLVIVTTSLSPARAESDASSHSAEPDAPSPESHRGIFTFEYGFNTDFYTHSTIHMRGPGYDFTLLDVAASDRPTLDKFINAVDTVAQFNLRLGYFIDEHWSVTAALDHMKYQLNDGQETQITGHIDASASPAHAGVYDNTTARIGRPGDIISLFEHCDGLNVIDVEGHYNVDLFATAKEELRIASHAGAGFGPVVTRTHITLFDRYMQNDFHLSGVSLSAIVGLRAYLFRYLFFDARVKAGFVALPNVALMDGGKVEHSLGYLQMSITVGAALPVEAWARGMKGTGP